VRNSVLAGLAIVAILDVVALVLLWQGGGYNIELSAISNATWIGLVILTVTGLPWSALDFLDVDGLAGLLLCSLLNGGIVGFLIGKLVSMHRQKAPTMK